MRINSAYFRALALGSSLLFSTTAFAQVSGCNTNNGRPNYDAYNPALTEVLGWTGWSGANITVSSSARVGDVLATFTHAGMPDLESMTQKAAARYIAYANCRPGIVETFATIGVTAPELSNVTKQVSNHNIGYRVTYPRWPTANRLAFTSGGQGTTNIPNGVNLYMLYPPPGQAKIEFILLSHNWPASRSVTIQGTLAESDVAGVTSPKLFRYSVWPVTFIPEACYFTSTKVINLALDPVDSEQFTGSGVSRNAKDIPLMQMRCSNVTAQPKISVRGTADASGVPGVLKNLATNSPATGVGILLEHTPPSIQPFAADLSGGAQTGSLGLVDAGSCGSGCRNWSLPMRASYYSTASTVTAGAVSARVTVDVTYP